MRQRFCRVCSQWHDVSEPWPVACYPVSANNVPYVISDNIEVRSMHDGQMYTSKSKLRNAYRAAGVEEIGNEMPRSERPSSPRGDIRNELRRVYSEYNS